MESKIIINELIVKLRNLDMSKVNVRAFIGLDGYIDKIQRAVESSSESGNKYYDTIADFGKRISQAAGKSGQVELVTQVTKLGGNAPIFAEALGTLGINNYCIGTFGRPNLHPEYLDLPDTCQLISLGNSAETNAFEFDDGKLIFSELSTFTNLTWDSVKDLVGLDTLTRYIEESKFIGLVDYTNLPHSTSYWQGILDEIVPSLRSKKIWLFDLCDPTKKPIEDIRNTLEVIGKYKAFGEVILGMNENEAGKIYLSLTKDNIDWATEDFSQLPEIRSLSKDLFDLLNVTTILVHPLDRCIAVLDNQFIELEGHVVEKPKISTGGGDNLNAGFTFGKLLDLSLEESMILGMATSGAYVQNGGSPDLDALISYLKEW